MKQKDINSFDFMGEKEMNLARRREIPNFMRDIMEDSTGGRRQTVEMSLSLGTARSIIRDLETAVQIDPRGVGITSAPSESGCPVRAKAPVELNNSTRLNITNRSQPEPTPSQPEPKHITVGFILVMAVLGTLVGLAVSPFWA